MPPKKKVDDDDSGSDGDEGGEVNTQRDSKGDDLVKQAEKKMASFTLFGKQEKYESSIELYDKAAAQYKMNKNWQEAAEAYMKCAEITEKHLNSEHEATTYYLHAAKAFKNVDTKQAIKVYQMVVENHMEHNRFSSAAKIWKDIGELQEKEHNTVAAQKAWQKAADCYEAEDSTSSANACHLKVASIAADAEDYKKAISIYEKVSKSSLESNLGRWSVKDYLYKALLCHFVMEATAPNNDGKLDHTKEALEKYKDMLPQFDGSRECKLIENCIQAFEDEDVDAYTTHVFKHDEIYKLDNWTAKILLEIKNALKNGPAGDDDIDVT